MSILPEPPRLPRRALLQLGAIAGIAAALRPLGGVQAQASSNGIAYPAGWNLIAAPAGSDIANDGPFYTIPPGQSEYEVIDSQAGLKPGLGYWAYYPEARLGTLGPGHDDPQRLALSPNAWALVGNPSGTVPMRVLDAAGLYLFDGRSQTFAASLVIPTGQAAWVRTAGAGVTVTPPLRNLADRAGLSIGAFVNGKPQGVTDVLATEFNLGALYEGWDLRQPQIGPIDFAPGDFFLKFANDHGQKYFIHPLVWHDAIPAYVRNQSPSRDVLLDLMKKYITDTMSHYQGKVSLYVVVNEAYSSPHINRDFFYQTIGQDYVDIAFETARAADSSAQLLYNDYDNHTSNGLGTKATMNTAQRLASKGLIDGIGVQMHLNAANPPAIDDVVSTLRSYQMPVHITEFDVNLKDISGPDEQRFATQARVYSDMLTAVLRSGVCKSFTTLGINDGNSPWVTDPTLPGYAPNAAPLMFLDSLQPKPAYFATLRALTDYVLK